MQKQVTAEESPQTTSPAGTKSKSADSPAAAEQIDIDLRDPWLAAFLAWMIPGMGHFYQRRWAKGVLFSVCILGTFVYGFVIGGGKVVYAAFPFEDRWMHYMCQAGVGLPAAPALVQKLRVRNGGEPWGTFMAPPRVTRDFNGNVVHSELKDWQSNLHRYFELGTVFTLIAGLLNILAIFDAWGGPVIIEVTSEKKKKPKGKSPPDQESGDRARD